MINVNPLQRSGNEGQPVLLILVWHNVGIATFRENFEALGVSVNYDEKKSSDVYSFVDGDQGAWDVVIAPGDPSVFGNDADLLLRWWYAGDTWTEQRMH